MKKTGGSGGGGDSVGGNGSASGEEGQRTKKFSRPARHRGPRTHESSYIEFEGQAGTIWHDTRHDAGKKNKCVKQIAPISQKCKALCYSIRLAAWSV